MGEADASKQARKAVAAAELSKPYSVTDQVCVGTGCGQQLRPGRACGAGGEGKGC